MTKTENQLSVPKNEIGCDLKGITPGETLAFILYNYRWYNITFFVLALAVSSFISMAFATILEEIADVSTTFVKYGRSTKWI